MLFKVLTVAVCLTLALPLVNGYSATQVKEYDLLIANGRIVDGAGNPWYVGDVAVKDGRIAAVGRLDRAGAAEVIDAKGLVVAPGFIDVHAHAESIPGQPEAENFLRMGVTTIVTGNCGGSVVPLGEFFSRLEARRPALNVASLVGHGSVRDRVMKSENRAPTPQELDQMKALVEQAMKDGAVGLSTGLIYVPGTYADTDEIVELAKVVAQHGGIYATHMRSEGNKVADSVRETLEIGRAANLPVEISHIKISSKRSWGKHAAVLKLIQDARAAGQQVTADQYAYTASSTSLNSQLPSWVLEGGREAAVKRLTDAATRRKVAGEMKESLRDRGFKDYSFAFVADYRPKPEYNGKNIAEITRLARGKNKVDDQIEQILEMYAAGGAGMVYHTMNEKDLEAFMRQPYVMVASDSGVRRPGQGVPHPRGYGNNARVLGAYVREKGILSLEDAVRKMTSLPAATFKLWDRGVIRPGMAADIVIFDEKAVGDPATFEQPHQYARGFSHVFVNGQAVIRGGQFTGQYPGQVLYGPGKAKL